CRSNSVLSPPVPHSFPTRRSSDLTMLMLFLPKILGYVALLADPAERRGCGGAARVLAGVLIESVLAALMAPIVMFRQSRGVAEVDRKSTRLNSSHVKISYAVFCLK